MTTLAFIDLGGYRVAFADSRAALKAAYAAGLPRDAAIRTSAPALILAGIPTVESVEHRFPQSRMAALHESTLGFVKSVYQAVQAREEIAPFALAVACIVLGFQRTVYKAGCLEEGDFAEPRAILEVETGNSVLDECLNAPWPMLLRTNPQARRFTFPVMPPRFGRSLGGVPPGLLDRLRLAGPERVLYRVFLWLWRQAPMALVRGQALILSENELVDEAAFHLVVRGFALRRLKAPAVTPRLMAAQEAALREALEPVVRDHAARWVAAPGVGSVVDLFMELARAEAGRQAAAALPWREILGREARPGQTVVLANYPKGGSTFALAEQCRSRSIPFLAFQHGVSREINAAHVHHQASYENNVADWLFAFSRASADVSANNAFARGRVVPVGLPEDYFRVARASSRRAGPPILYVSTALYMGNVQALRGALSDCEMAAWELGVIREVLARLPHRVTFKPYPALRYADPDPVMEAARAAPNIGVDEHEYDLRYLLRDYRIIVTARATSTVAWCLMSGKPLVFIDLPEQMPLKPTARAAFEAGTFLFDAGSATFAEDLRAFLSRPIEAIEADWAHKAEGRARLVEGFITVPRPGAGRRAARAICRILASGDEAALDLAETEAEVG